MTAGDVKTNCVIPISYPCDVFNGTDSYVEIPHNEAQLGVNLSNGFTISAWINPKTAGENPSGAESGRIIDKSTGLSGENGFNYNIRGSSNAMSLIINAGTKAIGGTLTYGVWTHVLVTVSPAQIAQHYYNGVASGSATNLVQQISTIITTANPRIGNISSATTRTFDGAIRKVKMWNRVLTTAEIAKEAADLDATTANNNLIHYFKLNGDYKDYGLVGVSATASNTTPKFKEQNVMTEFKASRVGATDKFMAVGMDGHVFTAVINES